MPPRQQNNKTAKTQDIMMVLVLVVVEVLWNEVATFVNLDGTLVGPLDTPLPVFADPDNKDAKSVGCSDGCNEGVDEG